MFSRPDAKFLKKEHIDRSAAFFAKYGKITIVLARFVPVVRTVATVMAGASRMDRKIYLPYSAIGGVIWVGAVTLAGYFLGQIEFIKDNVDLIFLAAVAVVVARPRGARRHAPASSAARRRPLRQPSRRSRRSK